MYYSVTKPQTIHWKLKQHVTSTLHPEGVGQSNFTLDMNLLVTSPRKQLEINVNRAEIYENCGGYKSNYHLICSELPDHFETQYK